MPNDLPKSEHSQVNELRECDEEVKNERPVVPDTDTCINDSAMMVEFEDASITEITVGSKRGPHDSTSVTVARLVDMTIIEVSFWGAFNLPFKL